MPVLQHDVQGLSHTLVPILCAAKVKNGTASSCKLVESMFKNKAAFDCAVQPLDLHIIFNVARGTSAGVLIRLWNLTHKGQIK